MRLVLLTSALFLVLAPSARADGAEDAAVKLVEKLGGTVTRDANAPGMPVLTADLSRSRVSDKDLKGLAGLKGLKVLNLFDTAVTDAGLKHLAALKELQGLDLRGTKLSDKGMADLERMTKLRVVFVGTEVSDNAINQMKTALPECKIVR